MVRAVGLTRGTNGIGNQRPPTKSSRRRKGLKHRSTEVMTISDEFADDIWIPKHA
jgi:hypothetical protein